MADLLEILTNDAGLTPAQYGVGPVWIGGVEYWSTGSAYQPSRKSGGNARPRADRANSDQYINFADYAPALASFTSNAINPAVAVRDDSAGVVCTADGSSAANAYTGLQVTNTEGFWDLSGTHTYPGQSADTVFMLDLEYPELPGGNSVQFSTRTSLYFITGDSGGSGFVDTYLAANILQLVAKGRRERIGFKLSDMTTSGAPDISKVKRIEVRVINGMEANTGAMEVTLRGLHVNVARKGRIVLSCDDGDTSFYSELFLKYVLPKNWGCSAGINSSTIGTGGTKMTVPMLKELAALGCEICNHSANHASAVFKATPAAIEGTGPWVVSFSEPGHGRQAGDPLEMSGSSILFLNGSHTVDSVTDVDVFKVSYSSNPDNLSLMFGFVFIENPNWTDADITDCSAFLSANGLIESGVFVYPGGKNNPGIWDQLTRLGFVAGRSVRGGGYPVNSSNVHYGPVNVWDRPTLGLGSTDTAASILAEADVILAEGSDCHIYGHAFVDTPVSETQFSTAELALLVEGIQARIDSGLCDAPISLGESIRDY